MKISVCTKTYMKVYSIFIHSQKLEATKIDKQLLNRKIYNSHPYIGIVLRDIKENTPDVCNSINESQRYYMLN